MQVGWLSCRHVSKDTLQVDLVMQEGLVLPVCSLVRQRRWNMFLFSRKLGEGFFLCWVHGSYHHESHCKEFSIITRVIAQRHHHHESHCKELSSSESLHRVIIIRVIAKSHHHQSHCKELSASESLQRVIIIRVIAQSHHHQHHCKESSSSESLHGVIIIMRVIAQSHSRESLARSNARESHWRGAMLVRVTGDDEF